jgi:hypothetical protein
MDQIFSFSFHKSQLTFRLPAMDEDFDTMWPIDENTGL